MFNKIFNVSLITTGIFLKLVKYLIRVFKLKIKSTSHLFFRTSFKLTRSLRFVDNIMLILFCLPK